MNITSPDNKIRYVFQIACDTIILGVTKIHNPCCNSTFIIEMRTAVSGDFKYLHESLLLSIPTELRHLNPRNHLKFKSFGVVATIFKS
jgi:hypothetical protein